jgi:anti-sigma regulatory factor (Ser/Thr protein kinase)
VTRKRGTLHEREAAASKRDASVTGDLGCARLRLACDPAVVAEARRAVGRFELAVPGAVLDNARLVVTELVTNSIVHGIREGKGWVEVTIERRPLCLRIEVADPASNGLRPVLRPVGPRSTSGWGLQLVDRLASEWGIDTDAGTRVWCELAT